MQRARLPISFHSLTRAVVGGALLSITAFVIASEWTNVPVFDALAALTVPVFLIAAVPRSSTSRLLFVAVGLALAVIAISTRADWQAMTFAALRSAAFIAAFFTALTFLRHASVTSPAIRRCGLYLADQPPGRRYAALTTGGHLFALILNYG